MSKDDRYRWIDVIEPGLTRVC